MARMAVFITALIEYKKYRDGGVVSCWEDWRTLWRQVGHMR
jgi:hypothetical protein